MELRKVEMQWYRRNLYSITPSPHAEARSVPMKPRHTDYNVRWMSGEDGKLPRAPRWRQISEKQGLSNHTTWNTKVNNKQP